MGLACVFSEDEFKKAINLDQRKAKLAREFLADLQELSEVVPAVTHHTERLDGSGFPDGLSGDAVPREAQIVGLACVFDDLLTKGGKEGQELSVKEALVQLREKTEGKFLPAIVNGLLIAYRRGILFKEDEHIFSRGI